MGDLSRSKVQAGAGRHGQEQAGAGIREGLRELVCFGQRKWGLVNDDKNDDAVLIIKIIIVIIITTTTTIGTCSCETQDETVQGVRRCV